MNVKALLMAALVASQLIAAAAAGTLIEDQRPGSSKFSVNNATNREILLALGSHLGFTADIQDEVWALRRRSFQVAGRHERLLDIALQGASHLFSYSGPSSTPNKISVLSAGTASTTADGSMFAAQIEAAEDPPEANQAQSVSSRVQQPDQVVTATPVADMLVRQAQPATSEKAAVPTGQVSQQQLARLTQQTRLSVVGLVSALEQAEGSVAELKP